MQKQEISINKYKNYNKKNKPNLWKQPLTRKIRLIMNMQTLLLKLICKNAK